MSTTTKTGELWMGPGTLKVSTKLFELNRERLVKALATKAPKKSIVLLQGGDEVPFYDTDITYNVFRQESYFMWTFGVIEPGCLGAVDVDSGRAYLFIPRFPPTYAIWMGPLLETEDFSKKYDIPEVHYIDEVQTVLKNINPSVILTLKGINSDSGLESKEATFEGIEQFKVNNEILFNEIASLRVIKTDLEIEVMKYVIEVSSEAHRKVMRFAKPGKSEYQCESEFLHHCYSVGGCRFISYTCICASHTNAAVLHYGHAGAPNNRFIQNGELCLFDMGANYFGYAADITCSFPANGKFTEDQKLIYNAVLAANTAVMKAAKPGVAWTDMHLLANKAMLTELKKGGLVTGDVDKMVQDGLGAIFQPHGLGHLIGLDVHDVGGYLTTTPPRNKSVRGLDKLRTARVLEEGMFLTIEPGCYFINVLLDEAMNDEKLKHYLVPEVIKRFRNTGGVRIEDDVMITKEGVVNFTQVPRTVQEIEDWIAGKDDEKYALPN